MFLWPDACRALAPVLSCSSVKANDETAFLAGLYYRPVSQLLMGLEGEYDIPSGAKNDTFTVDFVTRWSF